MPYMAFDKDNVPGPHRQEDFQEALHQCASSLRQMMKPTPLEMSTTPTPVDIPSSGISDGTTSPSTTTGSTTPCASYTGEPASIPDLYIAPENYGQVVEGLLHRSSFPKPENFPFLESLRLKTILTLVDEPFPPEFYGFIEKNNIVHYKVPLPANKETVKMSQCKMTEALRIVLDRSNFPLLIHCNRGKHRTGCVVASFRKSQGKEMDRILDEYHTYADPKARKMDEVFIETFDERTMLTLAREHEWREDEVGSMDGPLYHSPLLLEQSTSTKTSKTNLSKSA